MLIASVTCVSYLTSNSGLTSERLLDGAGDLEEVIVTAQKKVERLQDTRIGMMLGTLKVSLFGKNVVNEHCNLSDQLSLAAEGPRWPRYAINRPA